MKKAQSGSFVRKKSKDAKTSPVSQLFMSIKYREEKLLNYAYYTHTFFFLNNFIFSW